MDELDLRIRNEIYSSFVRDGRARTPAETAAMLDLREDDVEAAYRRLHDAHALVLQPGGTGIRMLNPSTMVFLRSEEHLAPRLAANGWEPGAGMSALKLNELARAWWWSRLDPDWRPRPPAESQTILDGLGLTGAFWRLA